MTITEIENKLNNIHESIQNLSEQISKLQRSAQTYEMILRKDGKDEFVIEPSEKNS